MEQDILRNKSFRFSVDIIRFADSVKANDYLFQSILNQLVRSATSIGANINEARGGISKKDFIVFFRHAFKSAIETEYWLNLIRESKNLDTAILLTNCEELIKILTKNLKTLENK